MLLLWIPCRLENSCINNMLVMSVIIREIAAPHYWRRTCDTWPEQIFGYKKQIWWFFFTFLWPCIVTNFFMRWFHKFILAWNSTCFREFLCLSSGIYSLYTQQWYMSYGFVDSFRAGAYKFVKSVHLVGFIIKKNDNCN
jgi:hypothetical protein